MKHTLGCLVAVSALALVVLGSAAPVAAAPYVSSGITLSTANPAPGGGETVTARGYRPGTTATFLILSTPTTLGTATVNANGVVVDAVIIPPTFAAGSVHTIEVVGSAASGTALTLSATVTLAGGGSDGGLALTGVEIVGLSSAALALILVGVALVIVARRRRSRPQGI